ncbi:MAG: alaS [Solirubrobacterales bacterium]|nr:alaS [Solirubrobacterales bacterium]
MTTDEIRETFLSFFEGKGHKRLPSASLVPATFDASVLLTTAGMHPLKPYFAGQETPPAPRMTSSQKCFRTTDIENVGNTARHLTFFEMLGNFSLGDYFKAGAVEFAWDLTLNGFGFKAEDVWVTVFEGDEELGLGPDEEAIAAWEAIGVPSNRIVPCPRSENFWQSGPTGPCGPCSELYLDRGLAYGSPDDLPGGENERFLEFWNLVFMQLELDAQGGLTPLPSQNIDTGMGLNRMATILQGVETIFETDQFVPLITLGRELATGELNDRSLRILADHSRAMTFLIADGVVPSNEDRGYILRRVMRRAVQHGRALGIEGQFLPQYVDVVIEQMGAGYPELVAERENVLKWVRAEEEGFGRTLESGLKLLEERLEAGTLDEAAAFQLHDTYGFPFEMTLEIAAEHGVTVSEAGFQELMDEQRTRSAGGAKSTKGSGVLELVRGLGAASTFTGYEHLEEHTVAHVAEQDGRTLVKLDASPFYAQGGGQVSDAGVLLVGDAELPVVDVLRAGEDQALVVEGGAPEDGARVVARVDRAARHATACNHTATHLLQAALRRALGDHVRQAGSYVGPDKLRFDFTHTTKLSDAERVQLEREVNAWIVANQPVRAISTTLDEAKDLGAMALFGEKYGDVVRMVEVGDGEFSRELCGGTHVRSTAEIGVFKITSEGSSASNVRRIEAVTGPVALELLRTEDALLRDAATALRTQPEGVPEAIAKLQEDLKRLRKSGGGAAAAANGSAAMVTEANGATVVSQAFADVSPKDLPDIADRLKGQHGEASAVIVGSSFEGKVGLVAAVSPALVQRGVKAGAVVKAAAQVAGGGGGGRDTLASAGGRDVAKLDEAIAAGRSAIVSALVG